MLYAVHFEQMIQRERSVQSEEVVLEKSMIKMNLIKTTEHIKKIRAL
jgi:hypothetical protein